MTANDDIEREEATPPADDFDPGFGQGEKGEGWGDYVVPAFIFLFCGVITAVSMTLDEALPLIVGHSMQPRVFPIFLMALIAVLNLGLIAYVLKAPLSRRDWEPAVTWATVALMGVFWALAEFVDIMLALIVVLFTLSIVWGERRIWVACLVAFGTTALIFFSFDLILEVRFPRGVLTDRYYG